MTSAKKVLVVLTVATLGIWGCAQGQGPGGGSDQNKRIQALEAKNAKLEDDLRTRAAALEQAIKKGKAAEEQERQTQEQEKQLQEQNQQLQEQMRQVLERNHAKEQEIQAVIREREELKEQLAERTSERDNLTRQYEQFRNNLRDLLGQSDAALPRPAERPVTSAAKVVRPGKS
jgi:chromosome segregation ATPase